MLTSDYRMDKKDLGDMPGEQRQLQNKVLQLKEETKLAIANLETELQELEVM